VRSTGCRAVIVGVRSYAGPLYAALAAVRESEPALIARFGVGHDGVDKGLAAASGIFVTNTPGVLEQSVAEHSIWLLGVLARHVCRGDRGLRQGRFAGSVGAELHGKSLAVIGAGPIGRTVARIAAFGFGMQVTAVEKLSPEEYEQCNGLAPSALRTDYGIATYTTDAGAACEAADVISLHLPANEETRHYMDACRFARLKPAALLVNTSRGSVLDEAALFDALSEERLGGAALDVFENEPYVPIAPDKDLRTLENVVLTPHVGSSTAEANRRMGLRSLENVRSVLEGRVEALDRVG
jgi:lactate dehydrogenase-like 2-hydroxyacid dehydrogenase